MAGALTCGVSHGCMYCVWFFLEGWAGTPLEIFGHVLHVRMLTRRVWLDVLWLISWRGMVGHCLHGCLGIKEKRVIVLYRLLMHVHPASGC